MKYNLKTSNNRSILLLTLAFFSLLSCNTVLGVKVNNISGQILTSNNLTDYNSFENPNVIKYTGDKAFQNIDEAREFLENYQEALRLLGVNEGSEPEQIKRAYRRLLSRHHPDKLAGSGASPERIREATDTTRQLHQAYALIRQRRGIR